MLLILRLALRLPRYRALQDGVVRWNDIMQIVDNYAKVRHMPYFLRCASHYGSPPVDPHHWLLHCLRYRSGT